MTDPASVEKTLVSFTDIEADTLNEGRSHLEAGETLDELAESLLRRFAESRNVKSAADGVKVERAVARAFREA